MYFNSWLFKFWPLKNYEAITLEPFGIFFKHSEAETDPRIIKHESVHVAQIKRLGVILFYILYLCEYLKNLVIYRNHDQAYQNISFEIEAYRAENS